MKAYTPANMRASDRYAIEKLGISGHTLMDRAAGALFEALSSFLGKNKRFVILCGKGNNGGDGWALAAKLSEISEKAVCISVLGKPCTDDALYFYGKCLGSTGAFPIEIIDAEKDFCKAEGAVKSADVIIDAIFGTGFTGSIAPGSAVSELICLANKANAARLAADIPSGADALTGRASKISFRADTTVTFAKPKIGMFSYPARELCGKITVADIGIPESAFEKCPEKYEVSDSSMAARLLPKRAANSNKGSYGRLLAVVGSRDMPGAAHLAASGALRCGAGLVCVSSEPAVLDILKCRLSEPVYLPVTDSREDTGKIIEYSKKCSAILIGCGLGTGSGVTERVSRLIHECSCPIILDADGINAVCANINILTEAKNGILLTPHPLEFSRLSGIELTEICENRMECAAEFSKKYNCTLLLKGAGTVIADRSGCLCVNTTGNSALAKGGSGDVLAGMISSFAAQGLSLYKSAVLGAFLHGAAGDRLSAELSEFGVLPSELPRTAAMIMSELLK